MNLGLVRPVYKKEEAEKSNKTNVLSQQEKAAQWFKLYAKMRLEAYDR